MKKKLRDPYLVQRCQITEEDLFYDFMGNAHYEWGARSESLDRIFRGELVTERFSVAVEDGSVDFFLVARKGFNFSEYSLFLEKLANEEMHYPEATDLNWAIRVRMGKEPKIEYWGVVEELNAWFDFENDVLFVLSQEECNMLVCVLERYKKEK